MRPSCHPSARLRPQKADLPSVPPPLSVRAPGTNSPVQDITAAALACNVKGTTEVSGSLTVQAGDIMSVLPPLPTPPAPFSPLADTNILPCLSNTASEPEWYHAGERGADPIDPSHKGPLTTWLAPYESNTAGDVWVKIAEEGWSSTTSDWAVDRVRPPLRSRLPLLLFSLRR